MSSGPAIPPRPDLALQTALAGFVALIVAMGIGRFALTPQLPLMIDAGQLDVTGAGKADPAEIATNPRARSAVLRVAEKLPELPA